MKRLILLPILMCLACQGSAYKDEAGIDYVKGKIGLGIDNKDVPNLVEFDVPVMRIRVVSPVLEKLVGVAYKGTGGILVWLGGISSSVLDFVGLAPQS